MFFMFKVCSLFLLLPIGNRRLVRLNACGSNTTTERNKNNDETIKNKDADKLDLL
jgi:hypothetical protein